MADGDIRPATPADVHEIWSLIRDLAEYEEGLDQVLTTPEMLAELLFGGSEPGVAPANHLGRPSAWCHVVEHGDDSADPPRRIGGFALWFLNLSTWTGRHGIYLEDLYVRPELRGRGYGQRLLATLAGLCVENGYQRVDWWVLDWNTPAIDFYHSQGAVAMDEWTVFRLTGDALRQVAGGADTVTP